MAADAFFSKKIEVFDNCEKCTVSMPALQAYGCIGCRDPSCRVLLVQWDRSSLDCREN